MISWVVVSVKIRFVTGDTRNDIVKPRHSMKIWLLTSVTTNMYVTLRFSYITWATVQHTVPSQIKSKLPPRRTHNAIVGCTDNAMVRFTTYKCNDMVQRYRQIYAANVVTNRKRPAHAMISWVVLCVRDSLCDKWHTTVLWNRDISWRFQVLW